MESARRSKIADRVPRDVSRRAELSADAAKLLAEVREAEPFLRRLVEGGLYPDAVKFLAHALPKREAVWWGILVVRDQAGAVAEEPASRILAASERWVRRPTDEHRRAVMALAEPSLGHPASFVGVAAFMSGGSLTPPDLSEVTPPEHVTGTMIANAVILTAVGSDPVAAPGRFRRFLAKGIEIANGPGR